ncbi:meiotic recombination protein SPO11-like isoform X2 [Varroa jacobsoni]|uniref:meiotic recombination protein SPO11-like isoform X2 n=1 Tax=Varroa jacobsoni TaxID=62625 RepID=UPI000BF952B9|nr:meiotic recombination protein SPO11-like isoform X2 [Varroa jacobsoni]
MYDHELELRSHRTATKYLDLNQPRSDERWARLMTVCQEVFFLLVNNQHSTVRRIFYLHENIFRAQAHVADSLEDLGCLLNCARRDLNVRATAKQGLVYGHLEWRTIEADTWCNCFSTPVTIPSDMRTIAEMRSNANTVLIVEKDTVFQKLLDQNAIKFLDQNGLKTILVTGKGVPDFSTREMLWVLRHKVIPNARFYALTDADPYGLDIAGIYAFGSLRSTRLRLEVAGLRWIGFHPSEIAEFRLDDARRLPLSDMDNRRRIALMNRPWIKGRPQWRSEVDKLGELRCKAEIEALNQFGEFFLLKDYLLTKLLADHSRN